MQDPARCFSRNPCRPVEKKAEIPSEGQAAPEEWAEGKSLWLCCSISPAEKGIRSSGELDLGQLLITASYLTPEPQDRPEIRQLV